MSYANLVPTDLDFKAAARYYSARATGRGADNEERILRERYAREDLDPLVFLFMTHRPAPAPQCTCLSELQEDAYGPGGPMSGHPKPPPCALHPAHLTAKPYNPEAASANVGHKAAGRSTPVRRQYVIAHKTLPGKRWVAAHMRWSYDKWEYDAHPDAEEPTVYTQADHNVAVLPEDGYWLLLTSPGAPLPAPTVWIVRATISAETAEEKGLPETTVEWQFSDGPPGKRGSSNDYLSLEEGLAEHSGFRVVFVP